MHPFARPSQPTERLILALDLDDTTQALTWAQRLQGRLTWLKVGSKLFTAGGPPFIKALQDLGFRIFLDLKYHDIPEVVAGAVREATRLGVSMITLHASGSRTMLQQAARAGQELAESLGIPRPLLLGVTVLTSLGADELALLGLGHDAGPVVDRLAALAMDSGLDGIVCSPLEIGRVRARHPHAVILTPGIRPASAETPPGQSLPADDQVRIATPAQAIQSGADYLVVGRPILKAPDPVSALNRMLETFPGGHP